MSLTPAQMGMLGAVNGYAGATNPKAAQGAATMSGMGGMAMANPYTAGIAAAAQIGTAALDDKVNMTSQSPQTIGYDNSGWAVTIGDGSSSHSEQIKTPNPTAAAGIKAAAGLFDSPLKILLVVGVVGGIVWYVSK